MSSGGDLFVLIGLITKETVDSKGEEIAVGILNKKSELGNVREEVKEGNAVGEVEVGNVGGDCAVRGFLLIVGGLLVIYEVKSKDTSA